MAVRQRDVNTPWHPYRVEMVTEELMGYLGYDLARWVTAYMAAGVAQNALALGGGAPMAGAYGVGMHFNVLDHEIMDPTLFEDRLRVNGGWQATYTQSEWKGHEFEMFDFYAALLGSVVNDLDGSKYFVPRSIAIYAGPIYADALGTAIRNRTRFGAAAGLEFHWSPHFAWHIGMNTLNGDLSPESGVYIRF